MAQFFPVDYDPFATPEDASYEGIKKLAGAVYHTVVDPWIKPLNDPYKGAILPFSSQGKGDLSFDSEAGLLGSLQSGATLPRDVYEGKVNPLSSEGFARVQDMSNLLAGGPVVGGGGAKASMGLGASGKEMLAALKNFGNGKGLSYDPNLPLENLVKHAMEVSGGDLDLAKDYIANKSDFLPLTSEQASTHGNAYALLANHQEGIDLQHLVPNVSLGEAGNKTTYHPDMSAEDLAQHAMTVSQNNVGKAKDFIHKKWGDVIAGSEAENNHYKAYDMVGGMGKSGTMPPVANEAAEAKPGSLPSTPHLSWTKSEEPKDLLAYDWITPHGLTSDEDPAHVAGMVLAASGGDVDKAKGLLKNNPFEYSSFFAPDKETLQDAAKHLDNPYFANETHTPVPLNADAAKQYNAFTDLPGYQDEEGKKLANNVFHTWLSNNEEHPSKLGDGVAGKDPWADLQSVTHPGVPAGEEDWPDLQAEMHKLLNTPESATLSPKPSFTGPPALPLPLPPLPIEGRHGPFLPEPPTIYRPFVGKSSYTNALQPFDWQSDISPLLSGNGNVRGLEQYIPSINRLTDDDLQRILEQGHNPNLPLFKGLRGEKEQYAYERGQFTNPLLKSGSNAERGIFFGNLPNVADQYGNRRSFFARPQNPLDFDWANTVGHDRYSSEMSKVLESAWDRGGDAVRIRNIEDIGKGGFQTQYVFRDPMALRYTHAKFDPAHVDSAQLSWTGGVPVFAQPVDYDPWEKDNGKN